MEVHRLPTPSKSGNGNLANYPPLELMELHRLPTPSKSERKPRQLPPLELMELHRLPTPSKSERKPRQLPPSNWWNFIVPRNRNRNHANYPPSNWWNFIDYHPPRNRNGNLANYPLELMELHRLPPLEIGTETSPTTPPSKILAIDRYDNFLFQALPTNEYSNYSTLSFLRSWPKKRCFKFPCLNERFAQINNLKSRRVFDNFKLPRIWYGIV